MDINKLVKVRENLREKLDAHTPDQRMNMSVMRDENPDWPVESGAVNEDVYWKEDWVETFEEYSKRAGFIVEEVFKGHDKCTTDCEDVWLIYHQASLSPLMKGSYKVCLLL